MTQSNEPPASAAELAAVSDATILRRLLGVLYVHPDTRARLEAVAGRMEAQERERQDPAAALVTTEPELVQGMTVWGVDRFAAQVMGMEGDLLLVPGDAPRNLTMDLAAPAGFRLCRNNAEALWRLLEVARLRGAITPKPVVGPSR